MTTKLKTGQVHRPDYQYILWDECASVSLFTASKQCTRGRLSYALVLHGVVLYIDRNEASKLLNAWREMASENNSRVVKARPLILSRATEGAWGGRGNVYCSKYCTQLVGKP